MDLLGGGSKSMQASRLLAVLWLFCASFAMQVIAVGQSVSGRAAAGVPSGNVASPDTGSSDRTTIRQLSRAVALPDFRFTGDRSDGKSVAGSDPAALLPAGRIALPAPEYARPAPFARTEIAIGTPLRSERIRAPPPTAAIL